MRDKEVEDVGTVFGPAGESAIAKDGDNGGHDDHNDYTCSLT